MSASSTLASCEKYVFVPASSKADSAIIFLHGLGDSGFGWSPVANEWKAHLPNTEFVFPHAPKMPVTLNGGMKMPAWHDIKSLESIDAEDFAGLDASKKTVHDIIQTVIDSGIKSERIVLGGFSQGGGLTLYSSLSLAHKLGGFVSLSGYLPLSKKVEIGKKEAGEKDINSETPYFIGHGTSDNVVAFKAGENARNRLKEAGLRVQFESYSGLGHSSSPSEMRDLLKFYKSVLPKID